MSKKAIECQRGLVAGRSGMIHPASKFIENIKVTPYDK